MKRSHYFLTKLFATIAFLGVLILISCKDKKPEEESIVLSEEKPKTEKSEPGIVEVVTNNMDFQMVKSIPSGWTTFKYRNQSADTHFLLLEKYPEGKTISDAKKEILPVFQSAMDSINSGKQQAGMATFGNLPDWFQEVILMGGTGLIAPGKIAQTTVNLEPGTYIVECYVKMNNGMFHSFLGMVTELNVTSEKNEKEPPTPTSEITISSANGIEFKDDLEAGRHTFKVNFKDQVVYPNFVGHDVNLVKLADGASLESLEKWINWLDPKGLISPIPEGFEFLGGVQDMPAGNSGYFSVNLQKGHYAFIAEIPNPSKHKMLKEFSIKDKDMALK
ncbi:hypothetical protein [Gillisia marina]|uniref:hypothetical protein n=1 Tax=Gillisia marina TaxID=1167637 RepID=UPI000305C6C4|nr:hypothetical protein [Gillisia marina]